MSRILIVEDEQALADSLQDIFLYEGHQVSIAHNGRAGLAQLSRAPVDLVLLDLMLPLMDGVAMLEALRRDSPRTPVLVVTACTRDVLRGMPVEGFLRKPFSLDTLLVRVKALLGTPAPAP